MARSRRRGSWWWPLGLVGLGLALYLPTLQPSITWYNSGELATAAVTGEIPHAPGYPLFTRLAGLAAALPWGEPAWRVDLLVALAGLAGALGLAALLRQGGVAPAVAAAAGLGLLTAPAYWESAGNAEVYTLEIALLTWGCWLALAGHWRRRAFAALAFAATPGLWLTHRITMLLYLPAWVALARASAPAADPDRGRRPPAPAWFGLGGVLGLLPAVDLYLRLQAQRGLLFEREIGLGFAGFWRVFTAADYRGALFVFAPAQLLTRAGAMAALVGVQLGALGLVLLLPALARLRAPGRTGELARALLWIAAANAFFVANYQAFEAHTMLLPLVAALVGLAGLGAGAVLAPAAAVGDGPRWAGPRRPAVVAIAVLLVLLRIPAGLARLPARDGETRRWGEALLAELPAGAMVVVNNDIECRPLQYLQYALCQRPDVAQVAVDDLGPEVVTLLRRFAGEKPLYGNLMYPPLLAAVLARHLLQVPAGATCALLPPGRALAAAATGGERGTLAWPGGSLRVLAASPASAASAAGGTWSWGYDYVGSGTVAVDAAAWAVARHTAALSGRGAAAAARDEAGTAAVLQALGDPPPPAVPESAPGAAPLLLLAALVRTDGALVGQHGLLLAHDTHLLGQGAVAACAPVPERVTAWRRPLLPLDLPPGRYGLHLAVLSWQPGTLAALGASRLRDLSPLNFLGGFELFRLRAGLSPLRPLLADFRSWPALLAAAPAVLASGGPFVEVTVAPPPPAP